MKFNSSINLEKQAIPYWREYYKKIFDVKEIVDIRKECKGYDLEIITNNGNNFKIDEKTRNEQYFSLFQKDNYILIEVCGNIESGKLGSSIFNSYADYWAYGWFNNKIINPIIFRRKPISEYIKRNKERLETKISDTNNLYHTENVLVNYDIIKDYQINNEYKKLVFFM